MCLAFLDDPVFECIDILCDVYIGWEKVTKLW